MEINDIIRLMEAVSENGLTSFKMEEGSLKLSIKKEEVRKETVMVSVPSAAGVAPGAVNMAQSIPVNMTGVSGAVMSTDGTVEAAAGQPVLASSEVGRVGVSADTALDTDKVVASPLVGTFYNSASPDADPFVKAGDTVKKGQVLGIIEAMKLMNEIESEYDGVVEAILVGNEDVVEYGQPLFRIR